MASIKGHMAAIKFFRNGQLVDTQPCTSFSISQDSSFTRSFYVGATVGEGDQTIEGWSGSCEFEVKNGAVDDFIDALITGNLNGVGLDEVTLTVTENYPDGTVKSYVYYDIQAKTSARIGGLNEKVTKTMEFQAAGRLSL